MNETTGHRPILARKGAPALVIKAGPAAVSWVARRTASTRRTKWLPSLRVSFQSRAIPDRSVTRIGDDAVSPRSLRSGIMSNKPAENGRAGHRRLMRLVRQADRKFATPPMRVLVEAGLTPRAFVVLETTGRRTGQVRHTPVGNGLDGDTFWLVAQRGLEADYVRNLQAQPRVRVKVGSMWRSGTAHVLPDDDPAARIRAIVDRQGGRIRRTDAHLLERFIEFYETTPVTVRIDLDPLEHAGPSEQITLARKLGAYRAIMSRGGANRTDLLRHVVRRPGLLAAILGYETATLLAGKLSPRLKELAGVRRPG